MANENTLADLRQTFPAAKEFDDEDLLELWQQHNDAIAAGKESDFGRLLDDELAAEAEDDWIDDGDDEDQNAGEPASADDLIDDAPDEENAEKKESGSEPDKAA
jgi:hypothetical protein